MSEAREPATCRGCGLVLRGVAFMYGGSAYHPRTGERCRHNFYGGYVCSPQCDFNSSLRLEQTMPGHDCAQRSIGGFARESYNRNWEGVR